MKPTRDDWRWWWALYAVVSVEIIWSFIWIAVSTYFLATCGSDDGECAAIALLVVFLRWLVLQPLLALAAGVIVVALLVRRSDRGSTRTDA